MNLDLLRLTGSATPKILFNIPRFRLSLTERSLLTHKREYPEIRKDPVSRSFPSHLRIRTSAVNGCI